MTKRTKVVATLTALTLATSCFIGGTIARYVTSTSSEDMARVAIWGINTGGTEIDLFDASYDLNGTLIAESSDGDNIMAPGTGKMSKFKILTFSAIAPEVMYQIQIDVDDSEIDDAIKNNPSIQWKLNDGSWGTWKELKTSILSLVGNDTGIEVFEPGTVPTELTNGQEHTISWQWLMDNANDEMDTEMGNLAATGDLTAKVVVEITAVQVDNIYGMLNDEMQEFHSFAPTTLSFRSEADIEDFIRVELDGEEVNGSNYELTEGSTIVTFNPEYLTTLDAKNHNVTIVSKTGVATTNFNVVTPTTNTHGFYYNQPYSIGSTALIVYPNNTFKMYDFADADYPSLLTGTYTISGNKIIAKTDTETFNCIISDDGREIYVEENGVTFSVGNFNFAADENYIYVYNPELDGYDFIAIDITKSTYPKVKTGINDKPTVAYGAHAFYDASDEDPLTKLTVIPTVPSTITEIKNGAFGGCRYLKEFIIPNTITELGKSAFIGCKALKTITIPKSISVLKETVFQASGLEKIYLPNTITDIEWQAFCGCASLTDIYFDGTISDWENINIDNNAFYNISNTITVHCTDGEIEL